MSGPGGPRRGRGAPGSPAPRYLAVSREDFDDGWGTADLEAPPLRTTVTYERAASVLNRNRSPDLPFDLSLNPYRGCEHGCVYCYARPAHAYVDLSPGLDFESRLFAKEDAPAVLRRELARPGYRCSPIALGGNTDVYQPIERRLRITRGVLEVLAACRHPVTIVTKSALVERDLDLLSALAQDDLVEVYLSVTSLERDLARRMEPRAAAPQRRIETLRRLAAAGVPCGVMFAPVIPALNDHELERVLETAAQAGARHAGYVMLRLPREVNALFKDWLTAHYPLRREHVLSRVRDVRDGAESDARFGQRMTGTGAYAALIARRFARSCRALGLNRSRHRLPVDRFVPPTADERQLNLF